MNLAIFRVAIGLALLLTLVEYAPLLPAASDPQVLRVPRLEGLPMPGAGPMRLLMGAWLLAGIALAAGWRPRFAAGLAAAVLAFVLLLDAQLFKNHAYLLGCVCLLVAVFGLEEAGDRAAPEGAGEGRLPGEDGGPDWLVLLLRCQVSIVYFFAAASKLNLEFVSGSVLYGAFQGGVLGVPELPPQALSFLSFVAILTEGFLAFAFWSARWRGFALWVALLFHAGVALTMGETLGLTAFGVMMVGLYALFFASPREILAALRRGPIPPLEPRRARSRRPPGSPPDRSPAGSRARD